MAVIGEFKQSWRVAGLALLILAFFGPWTYDVIHVPAEYTCSLPNIRLEGDFCGLPLSGMRVISFLVEGFIGISMGLLNGTEVFADRAREYLFIIISLLTLLPFLDTAVVIWKKDSRLVQIFHLTTWGLAGILGLYWSLIVIADPHPHKWRLWGVWAYVGLVISILLLEALALAVEKAPGQQM